MKNSTLLYSTLLYSTLLLASALHAHELPERNEITKAKVGFEIGKNGESNPNIFYPLYWNQNLYSGFGYASIQSSTHEDLELGDNNNAITIDRRELTLNLLTYELKKSDFSYAIGSELHNTDIKKNEFGYFQFPAPTYHAFNNEITINQKSALVYGDVAYNSDIINLRLSGTYTLLSNLSVSQDTRIKPLVSSSGLVDSDYSQDTSYALNLQSVIPLLWKLKLSLALGYRVEPFKYDLQELSFDSSNNAQIGRASCRERV